MSRWIATLVLMSIVLLACDTGQKSLFRIVPADQSGLDFVNAIEDTDSFNILTYEYIYNGGGVALLDVNGDSLQDVFFSGNMVPNRLYLNLGNLKFRDITETSGVGLADCWCSGIAVADVNLDGWPDLYIAANTHQSAEQRSNRLLLHKGLDGDGMPHFEEAADEFGLADTSYSTNSIFFDYDRDNDLDLFVINNFMSGDRSANTYIEKEQVEERRVDKLYRNDWNEEKGHSFFTDVSQEAGINVPGYSLGVATVDFNDDGWIDIYISNDFISNDVLYINQGDGTFVDEASTYFKHTSHSAMGNDVADINNDGLPDLIALDMLPEDNYRRKTMMGPTNYMSYINNRRFGYDFQYVRNTLQVHQGQHPDTGQPLYSEQAFMRGVSATDWSWAPLLADFDLDGYRDLIITNGFPRDITDRDFIDYQIDVQSYASPALLRDRIPEVKISNYAYRNEEGTHFSKVTQSWGLDKPSFSNGAAFGDLDNDGDLDVVVNNINHEAFLYENRAVDQANGHSLRIKLQGPPSNPDGIGAKVTCQQQEQSYTGILRTSRGFLSSHEPFITFGLPGLAPVDIEVLWADGRTSSIAGIPATGLLTIDYKDSEARSTGLPSATATLLRSDTLSGLSMIHQEHDYIDFNVQPLLPHKLSQYGPGLGVGDVDGDGLHDLYVGGSTDMSGILFMQHADGSFDSTALAKTPAERYHEETGVLFFDADSDGDQDLYIVSGGYEFGPQDSFYYDRFYLNVNGSLELRRDLIPQILQSGSVVRASDVDHDGDLDLLVCGRVVPHRYPQAASTYLFENLLDEGNLRFVERTADWAPDLLESGLITDACWTDVDRDGWQDLILTGEWMSIRYFKNEKGRLTDQTKGSGLEPYLGWWNSVSAGDLDGDGDTDYVCGNFGHNLIYHVSPERPLKVIYGDLDENGGLDAILTAYYPQTNGQWIESTTHVRNEVTKQLNFMRSRFLTNDEYARVDVESILDDEQRSRGSVLQANYLSSAWIENLSGGQFAVHALPRGVQVAPIYSVMIQDLNQDGEMDIIASGNDYGMEITMGKCDAFHGGVLLGVPFSSEFELVGAQESGFVVSGDAKGTAALSWQDKLVLLTAENQGPLQAHQLTHARESSIVHFAPGEIAISYTWQGKDYWQEDNVNQGFLSNSPAFTILPAGATQVRRHRIVLEE